MQLAFAWEDFVEDKRKMLTSFNHIVLDISMLNRLILSEII